MGFDLCEPGRPQCAPVAWVGCGAKLCDGDDRRGKPWLGCRGHTFGKAMERGPEADGARPEGPIEEQGLGWHNRSAAARAVIPPPAGIGGGPGNPTATILGFAVYFGCFFVTSGSWRKSPARAPGSGRPDCGRDGHLIPAPTIQHSAHRPMNEPPRICRCASTDSSRISGRFPGSAGLC